MELGRLHQMKRDRFHNNQGLRRSAKSGKKGHSKGNGLTRAQMVQDKAQAVTAAAPEFLVSVDSSCLMNIGGALSKQGSGIRTLHLAEVLAAHGASSWRPAR